MNLATEIICMPLVRIKAIKKAIAVLRRAGVSADDALVIVMEHQRAPYDTAVSYAVKSAR